MTHTTNSVTSHALASFAGSLHLSRIRPTLTVLLALAVLVVAPALAQGKEVSPRNDGQGFETVQDPALQLFADLGLTDSQIDSGQLDGLDLDQPYVLDHVVPLGDGRFVYAQETFTLRAYLERPARAALFLNGSAFVGNHWAIPVAGYDGAKMLAQRGYFSFAVDYLGTGRSFVPEHGEKAKFEDNREAMKYVLRYIRFLRDVPRIDLIGEGYGGSIAIQLGADPGRVRSVTMSAMIYKEVQGGPLTNPGFVAFLASRPNGYVLLPGRASVIFMQESPERARDYVSVTQGGFYPVDNFLNGTERPAYDPTVARVPGLVLFGARDFIAVRSDIEEMAEAYGNRGAKLVVKEDAGHAPRIGAPADASWYWDQVIDFLETPNQP